MMIAKTANRCLEYTWTGAQYVTYILNMAKIGFSIDVLQTRELCSSKLAHLSQYSKDVWAYRTGATEAVMPGL